MNSDGGHPLSLRPWNVAFQERELYDTDGSLDEHEIQTMFDVWLFGHILMRGKMWIFIYFFAERMSSTKAAHPTLPSSEWGASHTKRKLQMTWTRVRGFGCYPTVEGKRISSFCTMYGITCLFVFYCCTPRSSRN